MELAIDPRRGREFEEDWHWVSLALGQPTVADPHMSRRHLQRPASCRVGRTMWLQEL